MIITAMGVLITTLGTISILETMFMIMMSMMYNTGGGHAHRITGSRHDVDGRAHGYVFAITVSVAMFVIMMSMLKIVVGMFLVIVSNNNS